jgi:hypothetical protein
MDNLVWDESCELEMCLFTALEHLADQGRVQRNQVIMMRHRILRLLTVNSSVLPYPLLMLALSMHIA